MGAPAPNIAGPFSGSVVEASGAIVSGNLYDSANNLANTWTISSGATYGTATVNANGTWSYDLNDAHPALASLGLGQTMTDVFTVRLTDNAGTDFQTITITINGVACFARGTMIDTLDGPKPIEDLAPGDLLETVDAGPQPVQWVGSNQVDGTGVNAPIRIRKGTLGARRDLYVSPQHRILVRDPMCDLHFAAHEVWVPAQFLINGYTIERMPCESVEYFHVLLPGHHVILAEGVEAESFFANGEQAEHIPEVVNWVSEIRHDAPEVWRSSRRLSRMALRNFEAVVAAKACA